MIRAALWYPRRIGFSVHPLSRDKVPLSPHGFKDATKDPAQIRRWWGAHPEANVGTVCDWFFVVDVDPRNGGDRVLGEWREKHGEFPRTWEALTGSGGLHLYFEHDNVLDAIPLGKLVDGIDIKGGSRGYVLLPPSVNKSGPYRWRVKPTDCEIAAAPQWLLDLIVSIKRKPEPTRAPVDVSRFADIDRVARARRYAGHIPGAVSGQGGHDATIRAAAVIARGFALREDEAFAVLSEWNRTCEPPWSDADLKRKIRETLGSDGSVGWLLERRRAG